MTGTLTLRGNTDWEGPIIVVGKGDFQRNGGGNGHTYGGIVVGNIAAPTASTGTATTAPAAPTASCRRSFDTNGGGTHDTVYCSDAINQAMNGFPFKVVDFRQR